jgi:signal transduction histidine kinase
MMMRRQATTRMGGMKPSSHGKTGTMLKRRKWIVALVMAVSFLFLLAYNLGTYLVLTRTGRHLEQALDARLRSLAGLTVQLVERQVTDLASESDRMWLRLFMRRLRTENQLEAAYLIDFQNHVLLDSDPDLQHLVSRAYLVEDSTAIHQAQQGRIDVSVLHTVADNRFKSVYAMVMDLYGNQAIVVLEANADFLQAMDDYYHLLYLGILISIVMLVLLIVFLTAATSLLLSTEKQLFQAQRLASLGQMAATVAHEIRNPLAIIKGTAEVLRDRVKAEPELFGYIHDEIARLNRLVSDFLSYAREPVLRKEPCDLAELISHAVSRHPACQRIDWQAPAEAIAAPCDKDRIRQVLDNLLLNAHQAMENGQGRIHITLHVERYRGRRQAVIAVLDQGPGLQNRQEDIFEPFYTTKTSGTGLGLAVSHNIIESHQGRIEAADRAEGGSVFRFYLPL